MSEEFEQTERQFREFQLTGLNGKMKVTRYRDTNSIASIIIEVDGQKIALASNSDLHGQDYEQHAFLLAKMIDKAASDPCSLPKLEEPFNQK